MALDLKIGTMAGPLCDVNADPTSMVQDLKAAIAEKAGIPAHEQRLLARTGWDLAVLPNQKSLAECGLKEGAEVVLVRSQPYNGKYKVEITWNGSPQVEILGSHAKLLWDDDKGFEAEIEWDAADPHKATFQGRKIGTTEWAQRYTKGKHAEEDGVSESFSIVFSGDSGAEGFTGIFQREFEGPLDMKGTLLKDEVDD